MSYVAHDESAFVRPAEIEEVELYHPKTFIGKYVWSQDAKVIGVQYSITAIAVGLVALVFSGIMRLQLGFPHTFSFINPSNYLQFVTMHGMIMVVYLLTALFLGGFGNYLIPLMIGARDMVFPYVNMISYWVYLFAVLLLMASLFVPGGSTGAGWTLYPPQAILEGTPGAHLGIILMLVSLAFFIIGFTMGGLNYVVTVLQARARGMTMMRLPLTIWGIFMATILALLAFPALFVSAIMMTLDQALGTSFFMPALVSMGQQSEHTGGNPLLFQHLFWFFGHPEVYILALPGFGIVCEILPVFCRKPLFGYRVAAAGMVGVTLLSFFVWQHHLFVSGINPDMRPVFMLTTELISIPTGFIFLVALGTFWKAKIRFTVPMLFALGFYFNFLIGGISGVFLSDVPADTTEHGTFFVMAHFHYTIMGGLIFAFFGGLYYWLPKIMGIRLNLTLGKIHFWTMFVFFNSTFLPLFAVGMAGQPRRVYTYARSLETLNDWVSISSFLLGVSILIFVANFVYSTVITRVPVVLSGPYEYGMKDAPPVADLNPPLGVLSNADASVVTEGAGA